MAPIFKCVVDNGLLLQIDDPAISHDWEEARRLPMSDEEYERFIMLRLEALNAALEGIPEDRIRFHVCWGSWPGMHTHEQPLAHFARMMLKVKAQAFSIESAKSSHRPMTGRCGATRSSGRRTRSSSRGWLITPLRWLSRRK